MVKRNSTTPDNHPVSPLMREIQNGGRLQFADVGRLFVDPARPNGLRPGTVRRWAKDGVRAASGAKVFLEVLRIGGRVVTSREAIDRFLAAVNGSPIAVGEQATRK